MDLLKVTESLPLTLVTADPIRCANVKSNRGATNDIHRSCEAVPSHWSPQIGHQSPTGTSRIIIMNSVPLKKVKPKNHTPILVGGLEHFLFFHNIFEISSSQLTNSDFSRWLKPFKTTNQYHFGTFFKKGQNGSPQPDMINHY